MRKLLKWALWGGLLFAILAAAAATYLALTFDPNRYKPEIERLVRDETGRTLKLSGRLQLTFYPSVGVRLSGLSLSERFGEQEFLSLESAHASVKVLPLLRGDVVVDAVRFSGLKARVVQGKDGRFNFDDLLGGEQAKAIRPAKDKPKPDSGVEAKSKVEKVEKKSGSTGVVDFQVSSVRFDRAAIDYRDLRTDSEVLFSDMRLTTGRIAENAGGKLELSARAKGRNPDLDVVLELRSGYKLDLPNAIGLQKLDFKLKGAPAGLT